MYRQSHRSVFQMSKKYLSGFAVLSMVFMIMAPSCKDAPPETDPTVTELTQSNLFAGPEAAGELEAEIIDEASGLAASRSNGLYLWTHNDSGGDPALYLFTTIGSDSGTYQLDGASNIDWEDMAIGPGPDDALTYLLVADIGDNLAQRSNYTLYRRPEPDLNLIDLPTDSILMDVEVINFVYSDAISRDAETVMIDPATKDIYVVSKREAQVGVYRLPFPQDLVDMDTALFEGVLPFSNIVSGDISADGGEILLKDYFFVYHWENTGSSIYQSMTATPNRLSYEAEPQGEAIAWSRDFQFYFTLSEEDSEAPATLYSYERN